VLVPREDDSQFHLEFRQAVGYDAFLEAGLTNGVLLRYLPSGRRTLPHLIDFGSSNGTRDAALRPGTTFTDQNKQIKVLDVTSASALVEIVINGMPAGGEGGLGGAGAGGVGGMATGGAGNGGASGGMGGAIGGVAGAGGAAGSGGQTQGGASGVAGGPSGSAGTGGRVEPGGRSGAGSGGGGAGSGSGSAIGAGAGASPAAGGAGSGGGGASGASAGSGATATGGSSVVVAAQTADGEESGCGCRITGDASGRGSAPASAAFVAALIAFVRRRRRG
jgi:MYXO-CTERM domain-containing protein